MDRYPRRLDEPRRELISWPSLVASIGAVVLVAGLFNWLFGDMVEANRARSWISYGVGGSHAWYYVLRHENNGLALCFLLGASLVGLGVLTSKKPFSLQKLTVVVVLAGACGILPKVIPIAATLPLRVGVSFENMPAERQLVEMAKRLQPTEALRHPPSGHVLTPVIEDGLRKLTIRREGDTFFALQFPFGLRSAQREELARFYLAHFESVTNELAVSLGLQPIGDNDRYFSTEIKGEH